MRIVTMRRAPLALAAMVIAVTAATAVSTSRSAAAPAPVPRPPEARFATFNASLNRATEGELIEDLSTPDDGHAAAVAEIVQRVRPDVVLVNEFDYDAGGVAAQLFQSNYLSVPHNGAGPISYPYRYVAPSNTGIPSGFDLDNDGTIGGPGDAFGFGDFPGQYGMAVFSRFPIAVDRIRTFQTFRWADMPGALLPDDPATAAPADWYSAEELAVVRLSSKSHWDVPLAVKGTTVHLLVSHPTPPVFDGPEDRNGLRNHDEIRFWADYVSGGGASAYLYDDAGRPGGLTPGEPFVIAGDLNADPFDGDSVDGAAQQLLDHPEVDAVPPPASPGGPDASLRQGDANLTHVGNPRFDTADFYDVEPGNLRVDYVLPSRRLHDSGAGVFWPTADHPLFRLVGDFPFPSSDHRLVWVDVSPAGGR